MVLFLKKLLKINKKRHLPENLQLRFLTQLQSFLNNGYSLLEGLERVKWDKQMISIAELMIHALKKGVPIDRALEDANFHYTVTAYLYFVRESGNLLDSIEKCIQIFKRRIKYKQKFQQMIRYPLLLLFIFIILMFFIKNSILPSFLIIFQTSDDLPTIMKYTIVMIDYFIPIFVLFVILLSIVALWWVRHKKTLNIKIQLKIFKAIPMYRTYLKKQTSFQFATHLSALLKTGMPLKDILHHMSTQKKLPIISFYSSLMLGTLNKGLTITNLLPNLYFIDNQITKIFQKNSDKNTLEKDLSAFANMLSDEMHRKITRSLKFIQPVFFIILGIFIILVYLILMWPMFQMIDHL